MKAIVVYHDGYGCESGCCGHRVEYIDEKGVEQSDFFFDHPYDDDDFYEWAKRFLTKQYGEEHVADLDWDNCLILED
jgi:hypothetical protein